MHIISRGESRYSLKDSDLTRIFDTLHVTTGTDCSKSRHHAMVSKMLATLRGINDSKDDTALLGRQMRHYKRVDLRVLGILHLQKVE